MTNTGSRAGDEIAQLYFTDKLSSVTVYERIETLTIHWDKDSDCDYEILTTNGGGQLLPRYKGSVKGGKVQVCNFERTRASEVRVGVIRGKGTVKKLESPSLR